MKWDELTDEQKNELVHQKVFGWQSKPCMGPSLGKITRDEDPLNKVGTPRGLWHCSHCYYMGCGDESSYPHNEREDIPDYSTDMNDAWKIFKAMSDAHLGNLITFGQLADFAGRIRNRWQQAYAGMLDPMPTAEDICFDVLKALGVEIE